MIDDETGHTLVVGHLARARAQGADRGWRGDHGGGEGGRRGVAERALAKGIQQVVFDRGGYLYHGKVKELAEAARAKGLQF